MAVIRRDDLNSNIILLVRMLSSLFKKKPIGQSEQDTRCDLQPVEYEYEEDDSKRSKTIYYMPKVTAKVFAPDHWHIDDFQIGRHIGRGK